MTQQNNEAANSAPARKNSKLHGQYQRQRQQQQQQQIKTTLSVTRQ
jgi:hypothetical protein